jgi:hypothetical protein
MYQNNFNNNINTQSTELNFLPCPISFLMKKLYGFFQKKGGTMTVPPR